MRIFSLGTTEDFGEYVFLILFVTIPVFIVVIPIFLVLFFIYPSIFIDFYSLLIKTLAEIPLLIKYIIFSIIPTISLMYFFRQGYVTIFIDKYMLELENKYGVRRKISPSEIDRFILYKVPLGQDWGDLKKDVVYSGLYPIIIKTKSKDGINIFMRGEIWNALKTEYPNIPVEQKSILNQSSFIIMLVSLLNLLNGALFLLNYFSNH